MSTSDVTKADINKLIMDYLITEGYPSAARKFAAEANIQQKADLTAIEERVRIRDSIHRGDMQHAIELINDLNPELLDTDKKLHFSLLRLQLVELIRLSFNSPDQALVGNAIEFAMHNLSPYVPLDPQFKIDLERAMALLIVPKESWVKAAAAPTTAQANNDFGVLAELVDPSLRQKVAKDVNEAILQSQDQKREANIRYLVKVRTWAERVAREKRLQIPEKLPFDADAEKPAEDDQNEDNGDTEMTENGGTEEPNGGGDAELARYTNIPS
ncbi:hypothetical protein, variant 3 [Exophiala oligosperma]|nr:hypothetical protein, variant 3 [Exophiala oligosperma]KIW40087.1 hypothetical protein, variant 3 [Exophiala oligosperma]